VPELRGAAAHRRRQVAAAVDEPGHLVVLAAGVVAGDNVEVRTSRALSEAEGRQVADAVEFSRAEMRRAHQGRL
jgi:hypothetical protein